MPWSAKSRAPAFPFLVVPVVLRLGLRDAQGCVFRRFPFPQSNCPELQLVCFGLSSLFPSFFPHLCVAKKGEMGRGGQPANPSLDPIPPWSRRDKETLFSRVFLKSIPPLLWDELSQQVALTSVCLQNQAAHCSAGTQPLPHPLRKAGRAAACPRGHGAGCLCAPSVTPQNRAGNPGQKQQGDPGVPALLLNECPGTYLAN